MSKYLPIENLIYTTGLSKEQVLAKLTETITTYPAPYVGVLIGDTFEIKRAITYRNSFLPIIKGEIFVDYGVTKIKVTMRPHPFVFAFMAVWCGGLLIAGTLMTLVLPTQDFTLFSLAPFGMVLFGIALVYGGFKRESAISKKDVQRIFEAEIE